MITRLFFKGAVLALSLTVAVPGLMAQAEQQAQQAEQQYTAEEYDAYQKATQEPDLVKREDAIVAFMKANPNSALNQYAISALLQLTAEYQKQAKAADVVRVGEKVLSVKPDDMNALYMTAVAYYQLQKFDKVVNHGETVYAKNPNIGLVFILATSYNQLKNDEKFLLYGEKAAAELAPKDCYQILGELTRIYAAKEQWNKAAEYAKKAVEGFNTVQKPPQISDAEWKEYVNKQKAIAYAIMGRQAAERQNWTAAAQHYQTALKTYSYPALNAEAYYYIGTSQWKQQRADSAMETFARGSVQKGAPHAKYCRQYLEVLYKSSHNDSLAGIEEFVARVVGRE